ncbi:unnamed protein product [Adineta steineri]|uniref:Uncharacterized protein n=1 Tax=Adineta steineri TaxID=433720 RepID=A0A814TDF5_9BILA|nr:unnamed protein product [Adineta steineri]CAF1159956.1 unnamed protein product [Adineta steineri]
MESESSNGYTTNFIRVIVVLFSFIGAFAVGVFVANPHYSTHIYRTLCRTPTISSVLSPSNARRINTNNSTQQSILNLSRINTTSSVQQSFLNVSLTYKTDKVTTHHYDILYEKYLSKYVGSNVILLEIGLGCGMPYGPGASAYVWRYYLGPLANIYFLEFDRRCGEEWYKSHGHKVNVTMFYGSQDDITVLNNVKSAQGYFDVIVDDGGHSMNQQITSFVQLLPKVKSGGIYVIEDLLTSYISTYGGGYLRNSTTIEFIKKIIENIQTASPEKSIQVAKRIRSLEIGDEICFFTVK